MQRSVPLLVRCLERFPLCHHRGNEKRCLDAECAAFHLTEMDAVVCEMTEPEDCVDLHARHCAQNAATHRTLYEEHNDIVYLHTLFGFYRGLQQVCEIEVTKDMRRHIISELDELRPVLAKAAERFDRRDIVRRLQQQVRTLEKAVEVADSHNRKVQTEEEEEEKEEDGFVDTVMVDCTLFPSDLNLNSRYDFLFERSRHRSLPQRGDSLATNRPRTRSTHDHDVDLPESDWL
ncbi:MAG: hypothetical protein MHM6MM_005447 [Cercozoa sp. M6MM]